MVKESNVSYFDIVNVLICISLSIRSIRTKLLFWQNIHLLRIFHFMLYVVIFLEKLEQSNANVKNLKMKHVKLISMKNL
jgi:hypothetical protein